MFPIPSVLLIKIGAVLALCAVLYFRGYSHEHKKFVAYQAEIAAIGKAQETINAAKVKEHESISDSIKSEYDARLAAVHNYYSDRMYNASSSNLPTVSKPTTRIIKIPSDPEFVRQCAATTVQLVSLQDWVKKIAK